MRGCCSRLYNEERDPAWLAWQAAISSDDYPAWLEAYRSALERWEQLMAFEDEWETEDLLGVRNE